MADPGRSLVGGRQHVPPGHNLETVLNALPGYIGVVDLEGTLTAVNHAWKELASAAGLAAFVGENYLVTCESAGAHGVEEAAEMAQGIRSVLTGEMEAFTLEYPHHPGQNAGQGAGQNAGPGEERWIRLVVTPLVGAQLDGAIMRHLDITGRRNTAEALRQSEERYRGFLAQSSEGIWRAEIVPPIPTDLPIEEQVTLMFQHGVLAECNLSMAKLYGYTRPEEMFGLRIGDVQDASDPHNVETLFLFILSGYRFSEVESHEIDKEGQLKYFLNSTVGVVENGCLVRVWGNQRDVTERKQAEDAIRAREEYFRSLIENALDIITIIDADGTVRYESSSVERVLGHRPDELVGKNAFDLVHPDDLPRLVEGIREATSQDGTGMANAEFRLRHKDGSWRILEAIGNNLLEHASVKGIVINSRDITDRKSAEEALRESEERFRVLVQNVPGVVYLCRREPRYSMLYLSAGIEALTGYTNEEFLDGRVSFLDLLYADDVPVTEYQVSTALEQHTQFLLVYRLRRKDGGWRWTEERGQGVFDSAGTLQFLEGTLVDVTERKQAEEMLFHNALHDPLTDLPNRTLFLDRLKMAMQRARRRKEQVFAVQFIDLDRFKLVNDSLGHMLGDELLKALAGRLKQCLRPGDTVARLGGDEFAVLIEDLEEGTASAALVAERIQHALASPFEVGGQEIFSSASIGIAIGSPSYTEPEELLRDADTAMYRAKGLGRACHAVFDPTMHQQALARLKLETALRWALERQEFRLFYQPIVALDAGDIVGFEALLRWQHPELGLLYPGSFLAAAENSGLILQLGSWVLEEACRQTRIWQKNFPQGDSLKVNVNLHALQFSQRSFVEGVEKVLRETGLPPRSLHLELTEHVLMAEPEEAVAALTQLRGLGLGVCIDDFGIGYSSLSYLQRFPVTTLKIDRSFVGGILPHGAGAEIVQSITTLAHTMRLDVIAEGIESGHQLDSLRDLGCEYAQGFLFAPAVDLPVAEALLAKAPSWRSEYFQQAAANGKR